MQAYSDSFSHLYNLRWGFFAEKISPKLINFHNKHFEVSKDAPILDICCGNGHLAELFNKEGIPVIGLDLSEPMIELAKQRNQAAIQSGMAEFVVGDASDFKFSQKFNYIVSTFDALNHLESFDALGGCFDSVFDALNDDGWFIFDLNTKVGLRRWSGVHVDNANDEIFMVTRGIVDEFNDVAYTQFTAFIQQDDGQYTRHEETIYNTIFQMKDIKDELEEIGFKEVLFTPLDNFPTPVDDPETFGKIVVLARK